MPAFSFSKQKKQSSFVRFDKQVPTVGKYNITESKFNSRIKTAPSVSLTKAPRDIPDKKVVPGPGTYQTMSVDSKTTGKGISMKGTHQTKQKTQGPSPSQYDPKIEFPTKKFSFPKSAQKKPSTQGPDPGTYNANYNIINSTSNHVFSRSQRQPWQKKSWMKNVGPGYIQVKEKLIIEQRNQFSFTKKQKFKEDTLESKQKFIVPGPGKYDIHNGRDSKKSVKFTLATKTMKIKQLAPGPGAYEISQKFESCKASVAIGNSPREINYKTVAPGPGTYEIENMVNMESKQAPTVVFPKQQRMKSATLTLTVGPGQYNIPSQMESVSKKNKGFSIKGRTSKDKIQKTPGPQAYDPDFRKIYQSSQKLIFGKQRKLSMNIKNTPGPGAYEPKQRVFQRTFFFNKATSSSLDMKKSTGNIGPGQYKLKPYFGEFQGKDKTKTQTIYV